MEKILAFTLNKIESHFFLDKEVMQGGIHFVKIIPTAMWVGFMEATLEARRPGRRLLQ